MNRTILVVEDDHGLQVTLTSILEDEGYDVVVAENGAVALAKLEELQPALILLDIGMPVMDGITFADELRDRGLRPRIPVLAITADGRAPQKAERAGADGCLTKPFAVPTLLHEVERLAGREPA